MKQKQILPLILAILLLCGTLTPTLLMAEDPSVSVVLGNTLPISLQTTPPVLTVTPSIITLTHFDEPYRTDAVAFAVGTSTEELADWFAYSVTGFTGYDAQGNPYDLISGVWSLEAVDTGTPGVYYAWTTPDLEEDYTLADGVSLPRELCAVSIQTRGEPDINCCVSARGFLRFPWMLSPKQEEALDQFGLWLQQDNGQWTQLSEGVHFVSDYLHLSQRIFEYGSTYNVKVTYPGGQTGVLTFKYEGDLIIIDYSGGDRDGGDVNGGNSGAGSQPAPIPPQIPDNPQTPNSPETPDDFQNDGNHNANNSTPPQDNSSPPTNGPLTELVSSWEEPQEKPNPSSDAAQPEQTPVSYKSDSTIPAAPAHWTPESSETFSAYESPPPPGLLGKVNHEVSQQQGGAIAVMNPVPNNTDIQQEQGSGSQETTPTVQESYSPTQTVISGLRLRDLCAEDENVVFGIVNLTVSIPSKQLLTLNLSDSDTLSIKLTQPKSNLIMLVVEVSGKSVVELSGMVLRLRYKPQSENAEITIRNEAEEELTDTAFDGEFLSFIADMTGTYTILEASKSPDVQKAVSPLLPLSIGLLLAAGGITFFWRKRHV